MTMICAENIRIRYSGSKRDVIRDFNLTIDRGEVIALIGANGSGKSSLLRVLAGLQEPVAGEVFWNGEPLREIPVRKRPMFLATLFSNYSRVDGFRVFDMVALGRQPYSGLFGKLSAEDNRIVTNSLRKCGMQKFSHKEIATLSDGEFRKAMLAKLLAQNTPCMLLDEPTTHLDLPGSIEFFKLVNALGRDEQKTCLLSSHNLGLTFQLADRIILLGRNGRYTVGTPAEITGHELMCEFLQTSDARFENGNLIYNLRK